MLTIEKLKEDLKMLNDRKNEAVNALNQIVGGISVIEQMIERLVNAEKEAPKVPVVEEQKVDKKAKK